MKKTVYVVTVEEVHHHVYTVKAPDKESAQEYAEGFLGGNNNGDSILASSSYGPRIKTKSIKTEKR